MMNLRELSAINSIGKRRKAVSLLLAVLVILTPSLGGTPRAHAATSVVTFASPNPEANGEFGWSVAISDSIVVVGAPGETVAGFANAGRAYIFSSQGSLIATLISPNPQTNGPAGRFTPYGAPSGFGFTVGVSGTIVVVGAPGEVSSSGTSARGHAYTFTSTGSPIATLTSPNSQPPGHFGFFGYSVAVSGTSVVVGAPDEISSSGVSASGHAYICSSAACPVTGTLATPSPQLFGDFGFSVGVSSNIVAVAAPGEFGAAGRVYTFSTAGNLIATLTSPNEQASGVFGNSVAVNGTSVVAGAPDETGSAGHAYICSTTGCPATGTLTSPNTQANGFFGNSVGVSGTTVTIGAQGEVASAGHAYLCNSAGCPITGVLTSPNTQGGGAFGSSVGVSGVNVVVGAQQETAGGFPNAGHAYLFQTAPTCKEADGNGDFHGSNGKGNFHADDDKCEDGNQNQVSSTDVGDSKDFQSTQISTTTFDAAANTVTITGLGTHGGVPVAFTFVALETGPTTPGWVSFAFSDGYANAGTLVSGSILLH